MKYCGVTRENGRADRIKWSCPKVHMVHGEYVCNCKNPCTTAKKEHNTYTYKNPDFRMFPGIQRDSDEWNTLYKIRTIVERTIDHLKINMGGCRKEIPESHHYQSRCISCRHCQSAYRYRCTQHELSIVYPESQAFNCLKKYLIVIVLLWAYESTPKI